MKIEIMFHSSCTPKRIKKVKSVYTKGECLCVQTKDGLITRYPLSNIFSECHFHKKHWGS